MPKMKSGVAVVAVLTASVGCTPTQYENAYNQIQQSVETVTPRSSTEPSAVETSTASAEGDLSQSSNGGAYEQPEEKLFSEERDSNDSGSSSGGGSGGGGGSSGGGSGGGGGGAGGGSGGSWGG